MSNPSIPKKLRQVPSGTLHVGVDLALEKNLVVVINEKAERLDRFGSVVNRGSYGDFLQRVEKVRQKYQASEFVVAMEPSNYFWKLMARELEEKESTYHLVNAYTVKKHREGNQLDRSKVARMDAETAIGLPLGQAGELLRISTSSSKEGHLSVQKSNECLLKYAPWRANITIWRWDESDRYSIRTLKEYHREVL